VEINFKKLKDLILEYKFYKKDGEIKNIEIYKRVVFIAVGKHPVSIPNPEVKVSSVDGTNGATLWESRSVPPFFN
jgi:hypothetical protein